MGGGLEPIKQTKKKTVIEHKLFCDDDETNTLYDPYLNGNIRGLCKECGLPQAFHKKKTVEVEVKD